MTIRAIIIEDEYNMRLILKGIVKQVTNIEIVAETDNGHDGLRLIDTLKPDLVFLDIDIPGMNGIEVAKKIKESNGLFLNDGKQNVYIIFTTGYEEYAIEAFELYAFDYIVKPYRISRLKSSLERLERTINPEKAKLKVKDGCVITMIDYSDIVYIAREGRRNYIYTTHGKYKTDDTLDYLEVTVGKDFYRVHRSYIINANMLKEIRSIPNSKSKELTFHNSNVILTAPKDNLKPLESILYRNAAS